MTGKERHAAAETLGRVVAQIDGGEVDAPAWYRERLIGAVIALREGRDVDVAELSREREPR